MNYFKERIGKEYLLVILFLLVGFFLRVQSLGGTSYWIDEGFTLMQVSAIENHGFPLLNSGEVEKKDFLLPYLLMPVAYFFGIENEFAMRIIPVLFGTFCILIAFLLGRTIFNRNVGLIFSFLMTFSYWHIAWSRQSRGYEVAAFFVLLSLLFLFRKSKSKKSAYFNIILAITSALLAIVSKSFAIFLFPTILFFLFFKKYYKLFYGLVILTFFVSFFFRHLLAMALSIDHTIYFWEYLLGYYWKYFGIIFLLAIAGIYHAFCCIPKNKIRNMTPVLFMLFSLIALSFFVYVFERRYLFITTPIIFLYAAFCVEYFASLFKKKKRIILLTLLLMICIDFISAKSLSFLPRKFYKLEESTPQSNFKQAYKFLNQRLGEADVVWTPYPVMNVLYAEKGKVIAIPISYTGRDDQTTLIEKKDYYTGVRSYSLKDVAEIERVARKLKRRNRNTYVILDSLAMQRVGSELKDYIFEEGKEIFWSGDIESRIYVFLLQ